MSPTHVDVIATTISGSIQDWGKVARIAPLFQERGMHDVAVHVANSHAQARVLARDAVTSGGRMIVSAGGSGTFLTLSAGGRGSSKDAATRASRSARCAWDSSAKARRT